MARGCDCDDNNGSSDYNGNVIIENEKKGCTFGLPFIFLTIWSSGPEKPMSKVAVGLYAQNFLNQCIANGIQLSEKTERE